MSISKQLNKTFESNEKTIPLDDSTKIVFFSDCHRGTGNWEDDFAHNQDLFLHALRHYNKEKFTYVEVGDGDELWENKNFRDIRDTYGNIFDLMVDFHKEKRLYVIWGNHNRHWKYPDNVKNRLDDLFKDITVYESLRIGEKIFVVHGHQGQWLNDQAWWFGRFVVRNMWKSLQRYAGAHDPTSPAKNFRTREKVENGITEWAKHNKQIIIAGHTHRSIFPSLKRKEESPHYYNIGSCVHPRCITGIEIADGKICLIKWFVNIKEEDGSLFIEKKQLAPKPPEDAERIQNCLDAIQ